MDLNQLEIRASELRSEINTAASDDSVDADALDALRNEYNRVEARKRVLATIADATPEVRETRTDPQLSELETRARLADVFEATSTGRLTTGATAELQAERGLAADQIPLSLLETRATSGSAPANVGRNQDEILPVVFPESSLAFMGVSNPTVGVGERVYPVMTAPTDGAADYDEGTKVDDTDFTFASTLLAPRRIQRSFTWSIEDGAIFAGMEDALRRNLSAGLGDGLDEYVLTKTDKGLFDHGTDPSAPTKEADYAAYRLAVMGRVDGIYASRASDVRMLVTPGIYRHMDSKFRGTGGTDESALEMVMRLSGGIRSTANAPDPTGDEFHQAVTHRGPAGAAVAPIWDGIQLIRDNISGSREGEIRLTAVMLANFAVLRAAQYERLAFDVTA